MGKFSLSPRAKSLGNSRLSLQTNAWKPRLFLLVSCFVVVWFVLLAPQPYDSILFSKIVTISSRNGMQGWRDGAALSCHNLLQRINGNFDKHALNQKQLMETSLVSSIQVPKETSLLGHRPHRLKYEYCRNAFIDLGTNVGDSIGYFVDTAIDVCSPIWAKFDPSTVIDQNFPRPHLDVTELKLRNTGIKRNSFAAWLQNYTANHNIEFASPERTCVYGVEGNPAFTDRLQKLENFINGMNPRPVQHIHIHTETVVTAVDGTTKLYLDQVSTKFNVSIC